MTDGVSEAAVEAVAQLLAADWYDGCETLKDGGSLAACIDPPCPCRSLARAALLLPFQRRDAGWQPIETAPKDGTRFFVASKYGVDIAGWSDTIWANAGRGAWIVTHMRSDTEEAEQVTHWQPLPSPPSPGVSQ